ncbi:MAG: pyridoxal phosphate-dependent aminotransferase [Thermocladium sp.]
MPGFSNTIGLLRESPTRRIDSIRERLRRENRDIIVLSTGQPSIPPPPRAREELAKELIGGGMELFGYTPSQGMLELREAISSDLKMTGGIDVDPNDVAITAGGQEAMFATFMAILNPGDEVILMDPTYFGYKPILEYLGAKVRRIRLSMENGFKIDVEELKRSINPRTKAVVLVSPDNPTGTIIGSSEAKALADLARDRDFWLVSDEAYRMLVYEGRHEYLYKYAPERTISINTFSKDPGMPGWRLGFVYGPSEAISRVKLAGEELTYCPPAVSQRLAIIYLKSSERMSHVQRIVNEYRSKRDLVINEIRKQLPYARFHIPQGSMFIFLDLSSKVINGDLFAEHALTSHGVAVVPGSYFSDKYRGAVRVSFVWEPSDRLIEGINRLSAAVESWKEPLIRA